MWYRIETQGKMYATPAVRNPASISTIQLDAMTIHRAELIIGPDGKTVKDRFDPPFRPWFPRPYRGRMGVIIMPAIKILRMVSPSNPAIRHEVPLGYLVDVYDMQKWEYADDLTMLKEDQDEATEYADSIAKAFTGTVSYINIEPMKQNGYFI